METITASYDADLSCASGNESLSFVERLHTLHHLLRCRWSAERTELNYVLGRDFEGGSLLDIGAYRGVYSFWLHRRFHKATRIVAFEPQPELAKFLRAFRKSFSLERLDIVRAGLSSHTGSARMHRPSTRWAAATIDDYWPDDMEVDEFDVPVMTVDEYLASHPKSRPVRFMKCNVQNHEADVLAGAEQTLCADRPELLVEWSTPRRTYRERLFQLARRLDYTIFQFEFGCLLPCTTVERRVPPSWELGSYYVMLPREKVLSRAD
jgi:FkbM family methyltransferase